MAVAMLKDREPTEFGWHIQRLMAGHEPPLSQTDLARRAGLGQSSISRYIYGTGRPDTDKLYRLAMGLAPVGATQDDIAELYQDLLARAGHGRPADTVAEAAPVHRLARELDAMLADTSPIPADKRVALEAFIDQVIEAYRPLMRRRRSA